MRFVHTITAVAVAGVAAGLLGGVAASAQEQTSPYAGLEDRQIKALSPEQVAQYLEGEGMGLALPAELNGYPGPKHVLELAEQLELDTAQAAKVKSVFDAMHEEAVRLGEAYVELERGLDGMFASSAATAEALRGLLDELGSLQSKLRYVHLHAHLETRELLTEAQVARYVELRGYGGDGDGHHGHHDPRRHHGAGASR